MPRVGVRAATLATVAAIGVAGVASAVGVGLSNPGFESDLDGWSASIVRDGVYLPAECRQPDGICIVGTDQFTTRDATGTEVQRTISPIEGSKMVRLGGPFPSADVRQVRDRYRLEQSFVVDAANPVLRLNYNVFTYDYTGFDELRIRARVFDGDGDLITQQVQGAFGAGTALKSSGWVSAAIDLTGYEGTQVNLVIDSGGTRDELYGFWAYIDAGTVPETPIGSPAPQPVTAPSGATVPVSTYEVGDKTFFTVPQSSVSQFPNGCLPLTLDVPINAGGGTVSAVSLLLNKANGATMRYPMADTPPEPADGMWRGTIDCAATGDLLLEYTLTEEGVSQTFVVPIGGLTLIDPAGVVYDKERYDAEVAGGKSPEQARAAAAVVGASVRLQRKVGGAFVNVLAGDPGISPNVNPQTTGATGVYQWDVSAGTYRVVVTRAGYGTPGNPADAVVESSAVDIPPPVLDLHVPLVRQKPQTAVARDVESPQPGQTVTFTATTSHPAGAAAISGRAWDLDGDGAFDDGTGATAQAQFAAGRHTVRHRVTDDDGDAATASTTFDVAPAPQPAPAPLAPVLLPAFAPASGPVPGPAGAPSGAPKQPSACAGKTGKALKTCRDKQRLAAKIAKQCGKLKGKRKSDCRRRLTALAKCNTLKGKKRSRCVARANRIGRK